MKKISKKHQAPWMVLKAGAGVITASSMALSLHLHSLNQSLEQSFDELSEKHNKVLVENEDLQESIIELNGKVEKLTEQLDASKKEMEEQKKETEALLEQREAFRKEIQRLENALNEEKSKKKQQTISSRGASSERQKIQVEATAYTAYCNGCSGVTATGLDLRANPDLKVIAVDPNVIPLGTKVHVEGYGYAIAADTGGAIKGHRIDVFIPSKEKAMEWGRQKNVTVTILQ